MRASGSAEAAARSVERESAPCAALDSKWLVEAVVRDHSPRIIAVHNVFDSLRYPMQSNGPTLKEENMKSAILYGLLLALAALSPAAGAQSQSGAVPSSAPDTPQRTSNPDFVR